MCVCVSPFDKLVPPIHDGEFPSFLTEQNAFLRPYVDMNGGRRQDESSDLSMKSSEGT